MDYKAFKSGSDIRGYGLGDETNPLYLSDEFIQKVTLAFLIWLKETGRGTSAALKVAVGHDPRLSGQRIQDAVTRALCSQGVLVLDCGVAATPAMFMTTVHLACDGAIQITASHHPKDRNGLKFFHRGGGLEGAEIAEILQRAAKISLRQENADWKALVRHVPYMQRYAEHLRQCICDGLGSTQDEKPLAGHKIVVVAGNGAGGFYATDVLQALGADIRGSRYLEPDGNFPHFVPNPENPEVMRIGREAVLESGAALGIVFDTDVDRVGCIDKNGQPLNRNRLIALCAAIVLEDTPGATIVTDSVTSDGLHAWITQLGGTHLRYKRGYQNVIGKQKELVQDDVGCPLAMETSGHGAFSENYFLDDGAYLATRLIIQLAKLAKRGKTLEERVAGLQETLEEKEIRLKIREENFRPIGEVLIAQIRAAATAQIGWQCATKDYEGVRVSTDMQNGNGWFLVRLSVHDPIVVINFESNTIGGNQVMAKALYTFVRDNPQLDSSALQAWIT